MFGRRTGREEHGDELTAPGAGATASAPTPSHNGNEFLKSRAGSFRRRAEAYKNLYEILGDMGLEAVSGDVTKLTTFEALGMDLSELEDRYFYRYWPMSTGTAGWDAGVIEIRHPQLGFLARITVGNGDFYGATLWSGNHDWNGSELKDALKVAIAKTEND